MLQADSVKFTIYFIHSVQASNIFAVEVIRFSKTAKFGSKRKNRGGDITTRSGCSCQSYLACAWKQVETQKARTITKKRKYNFDSRASFKFPGSLFFRHLA